ncbi:hypothetical protein JGG67_23105, partial [Salmonella enterica subsp. enterica serovar Derby]|nr:hypothetical protein [Salmonella enterica subsp. enterica serovar Derby]
MKCGADDPPFSRTPAELGGEWLHPTTFQHRVNRFFVHPNRWVAIEWSVLGSRGDDSPTVLFTDGSSTDRGVGAAFCTMTENRVIASEQFKLSGRCSNNQADAYVIQRALMWIFRTEQTGPVCLVSDSQSVISALSNPINDWALIVDAKILHRRIRKRGVLFLPFKWLCSL